MKSLILCTLFLGLALAGKVALRQTTCECGWTNSGRIVGGKETTPNQYPWMVAISTGDGEQFCGGSIITPYHVLTAAHCAQVVYEYGAVAVVGAHNVNGRNRAVPITKAVIHKGWNHNDLNANFDIAILVTAREIPFSKTTGPVCMPSAPLLPGLDNKFIKVMGWGLTTDNGDSSPVLREVDLKVLPRSQCKKFWSRNLDNKLCAFGVKKDSCQGDSGGPLVWLDPSTNKYTQVALVSYGADCGGPNPSVNSDVSAYLSWINQVIDITKPGVKTCSAAKKH